MGHEVLVPGYRLGVLFLSVLAAALALVVDNTSKILRSKVSLLLDANLGLVMDAVPASSHGLDIAVGLVVTESVLGLLVGDACVDLQQIGLLVHIWFMSLYCGLYLDCELIIIYPFDSAFYILNREKFNQFSILNPNPIKIFHDPSNSFFILNINFI